MKGITPDRRKSQRYDVHLPLRYRMSLRGTESRWNSGVTRDMSKEGLAFKSRRSLPIGAHVELRIDWPVRHQSAHTIDLQATGFVIRSENGRTAVRLSSHRFLVHGGAKALSKTA